MKTITSLLLLLLIPTTATTQSLRHEHHDRTLQEECTLRSTYLGCYSDKNNDRALPFEVFGSQSRGATPQECEAACGSSGYDVWGLEFKGQCFCGHMNASDGFGRHGVSSGCDCCGSNVGTNKFCAYALDVTAPGCGGASGVSSSSTYVGCYENRNNARALPVQISGKGHSVEECESVCKEKGYDYFAREWKGQCFCGTGGYDVHGPADDCDCCGDNVGGNKMCVWHSME